MVIPSIDELLTRIKQIKIIDQLFKFYVVSSISGIVNLGSRYFLNLLCSFVGSVFISSILGGIIQFILARNHVFHSTKNVTRELILYGIIAIFSIFLITALCACFEKLFEAYNILIISQNMTYFIIQLTSLGINSIIGFFLCKYIIFTGASCKHKTD